MTDVWIATRTLAAIDDALARDNGNAYRRYLQQTLPAMGDAYRNDEDGLRTHLGASVIAQECARAVAYGWHWALLNPQRAFGRETKKESYARSLRIWNRGHLEEGRLIALLLQAGIQVFQQDAQGKQFRISAFNGHFGGSTDGVARGVPDLPPGIPCLLEFKTHNSKSFAKLLDDGVRASKPTHFGQVQMYMGELGVLYALYLASNKDTDELYAEIVMHDKNVSAEFLERARAIIFDTSMLPDRVRYASPSYFLCKYMCDYKDVCFHTAPVSRNCRTCEHSLAAPDGTWRCKLHNTTLDKRAQLAGCDSYVTAKRLR